MNAIRTARIACMLLSVVLLVSACGGPTQKTIVRGILSFDETSAVDLNQHRGYHTPKPDVCGRTGEGFLKEIANGTALDQAKIQYEWAPIVGGTTTKWPTVDEPQFYAAGTITASTPVSAGSTDFMFAHPWSQDYSADFDVDNAFTGLNYRGNSMHLEIEQGLMPHTGPYLEDLWYKPQVGDRIIALGDWIMDCGHPDPTDHTPVPGEPQYGTEIHPPSFLAFGHNQGGITKSYAFANPYRVTQLYTCNEAQAAQIGDYHRFNDSCVYPFPLHAYDEVLHVIGQRLPYTEHTSGHVLVQPTDFGAVGWYVCAPSGFGTGLRYRYHFITRTGVGIQAIPHEDIGCVQFVAAAGGSYTPMPLDRSPVTWPWTQINAFAGFDVNKTLKDKVHEKSGNYSRDYVLDRDPYRDQYPQLNVLPGAANDQQLGISTSDNQPFPFYGWAEVGRLPEVHILGPADGATFSVGQAIALHGYADDAQDGPLADSKLVWMVNGTVVGTGRDVTAQVQSQGDATISLTATGSGGNGDSNTATIKVHITAAQGNPSVVITAPATSAGSSYGENDVITFKASAHDASGNPIPDASIVWTDDLDGQLGTGATLQHKLSGGYPAVHHVTVTVTDSAGKTASDYVTVYVTLPIA